MNSNYGDTAMKTPSFRWGMRVALRDWRGRFGTVKGSEYDEETRLYQRYVLWDVGCWETGVDKDNHNEPELVDVRHLRPLTAGEAALCR
jgi:hypothetical protein